jgi:transcriptional regulator with XRE-family HTH domain
MSIEKFSEDFQLELQMMKSYTLTDPREPGILNAMAIANTLNVSMLYLFGLDWGELVYLEPPTVSSLLNHVWRALRIPGIKINTDFVSKEVIVSATDKFFQDFFEKIDLSEDLSSNFPTLVQVILQAIQDETNSPINGEEVYSNIVEDNFFKRSISQIDKKLEPELYYPILWDTVLDAISIEREKYAQRLTPYPNLTEVKLSENFKNRISYIKEKYEFSVQELVNLTDLSESAIDSYLKQTDEVKLPRINTVIDIACALNVNFEYLLGLDDSIGTCPNLDTLESKFINLFKALKNANFKIREDSNHQKIAYTKNPYVYRFLDNRFDIHSVHDAYQFISGKIDSENLRVMNGEIVLYDDRIEKDPIRNVRFHIENDLYNSNT